MPLLLVQIPIIVGPQPPCPQGKLAVRYVEQGKANWCWAACAEMVLRFIGMAADQCQVASFLFNDPTCCQADRCNCPCYVNSSQDDVEKIYKHYQVKNAYRVDSVLAPDVLGGELAVGPVEITYDKGGGQGHLMLVFGACNDGGGDSQDRFWMHDPNGEASQLVSYENLLSNPIGSWQACWRGLHT